MPEFQGFGKIPRYSRDIVITEKIDGTNAQIHIEPMEPDRVAPPDVITYVPYNNWSYGIWAGSRSRWITPQQDNHGFAEWVLGNATELVNGLGPGTHFGEWWGSGINRGYDLPKGEKRFSLFNTGRWLDRHDPANNMVVIATDKVAFAPDCCYVVPILYTGDNHTGAIIETLIDLEEKGSAASPCFMNPEGVIIYHTAANSYFKKTIKKDELHKFEA